MSGLVYGLFGILQTVALYFAFQISKVKVKGLNDAKCTAAVVYVITALVVILVVTNSVFNWVYYINMSASINGIVIWLVGTSILGFVFVPKVLVSKISIVCTKSTLSAHVQTLLWSIIVVITLYL